MHNLKRYLEPWIEADLKEKMVFLGGPRQVGKTTVALHLLGAKGPEDPSYLNWDDTTTKKILLSGEIPSTGKNLLVFDEIHKYKSWRNFVKGVYDRYRGKRRVLVTGSARLDYYRRGGDSLQGRYHYYRLHPLSLHEVGAAKASSLEVMLRFGGFPEPFFTAEERHFKRWQSERKARVIQEDLISLEHVKVISQLDLLLDILPSRIGSPLSIANLSQDLEVAFETTERWVQIFERLYYVYRLQPFGFSRLRAAKKEKKLYFWDWSLCEGHGAKFENLVASHLLKYCHFLQDTQGEPMELRFLRDAMKREIDFIVLKNGRPAFAVECKTGETGLSPNIAYFASRTNIPVFYQVHMGKKDVEVPAHRARILPFVTLASEMRL